MITRPSGGAGVRTLKELGQALHSRPFQIALGLSLLVHAVLLFTLGDAGAGRAARRIPLMRVRILQPEARPAVAPRPAPSATAPRAPLPAPEARGEADVQAPSPQPSAATSATRAPERVERVEPVFAGEEAAAGVARPAQMELPLEPASTAVVAQSAPDAPAESAAVDAAAAAPVAGANGASGAGEGGPPAADTPAGLAAPAAVPGGSGAGVATGPAAAAAGRATAPPPAGGRDLAAIRRRIDAHKTYPPIAVRNGWEGRVLVEMRLEGDGRLASVRLLRGSGHAVLDEATIDAVRLASPFPPLAPTVTVPVEYRLVP